MATNMDTFFATRDAYLAGAQITETYRELYAKDNPNPHASMLAKFVDDIVKADQEIARLGAIINDRIQRVNESIAKGYNINSLGELQRAPIEYDAQCANRQNAAENLRWVAASYRKAAEKN